MNVNSPDLLGRTKQPQLPRIGRMVSAAGNPKSRICELCGKGFSSRSGYMNHINSHRGVFRFSCPECGKGFTCTKNLKQHLTGHTGVNYFECQCCPETFRYYEQLQQHQATCCGHQESNIATTSSAAYQTDQGESVK